MANQPKSKTTGAYTLHIDEDALRRMYAGASVERTDIERPSLKTGGGNTRTTPERSFRWALQQFDPCKLANWMCDKGITLEWFLTKLHETANSSEHSRERMQAFNALYSFFTQLAISHPNVDRGMSTTTLQARGGGTVKFDAASHDPLLDKMQQKAG